MTQVAVTEASGPRPLVDIITGLIGPSQEACCIAMRHFVEWRNRDEARKKAGSGCDEPAHIADGVRVSTALSDAFAEVDRMLVEADKLAGGMLSLLEQRGGLLVDMGVDAEKINRDHAQVEEMRETLRRRRKLLKPLADKAKTMPITLGELAFAVEAARSHASGRTMAVH